MSDLDDLDDMSNIQPIMRKYGEKRGHKVSKYKINTTTKLKRLLSRSRGRKTKVTLPKLAY